MLGVGFSDADEDDIKITNNEGRSGQPESATTFTNLVNEDKYQVREAFKQNKINKTKQNKNKINNKIKNRNNKIKIIKLIFFPLKA